MLELKKIMILCTRDNPIGDYQFIKHVLKKPP